MCGGFGGYIKPGIEFWGGGNANASYCLTGENKKAHPNLKER